MDYIEVAVEIRRKHIVQNGANIWIYAPAAGEGLGAAFWVDVSGAADFGEGLGDLVLTKQKIPVTPGHLGGKRIGTFCLAESLASTLCVSLGFIGSREVGPGISIPRIQGQSRAITTDGALGVRLIHGVLPISSEKIPIFRIRGFQTRGRLEPGECPKAGLMRRPGRADAEICEAATKQKSERRKSEA